MDFEKSIGISNIVLVQPSIYGNDNSCLLDALKAIGPRHGRGVVGIDPNAVEATILKAWHKLGVRGVRLNLKSVDAKYTEASLQNTLRHYADVIRPFNWILELYIGMEDLPILEEIAGDLGVRLCIAHFGSPTLSRTREKRYRLNPYELAGFQSLINLLESGSTWVKFSAVYRFDNDPKMLDTSAMASEILRKAGNRVVFASDWPHTRFDGLDVRPFVESCLEWAHEAGLADEVFSANSRELWDATS
ncbi:amidohydrolase 2 [Corynespora cassiicola Philippines]|uniref:Amidohydrolase 2 n=1 Tax=Corynespora cassiicola Philippines TaxID=1448308 RepID=A0A2T2N8Y7_CORCC|nr:amidohydrolase 2 [Corynespora cassiicola Philippines]